MESTGNKRRFAVRPRTLLIAIAIVLILAGAGIWLVVQGALHPGRVELKDFSSEATGTVSFAGVFPSERRDPLSNPLGIAWGGDTLYVAESDAGRIRMFDSSGGDVGIIGLTPVKDRTVYPASIALTQDGRMAVVDNAGQRVIVIDAKSAKKAEPLFVLADPKKAEFRPTAVACSDGEFYVFDAAASAVRVYDSSGKPARVLGEKLTPPIGVVSGMCVAEGVVYLTDTTGGRVVGIGAGSGELKTIFRDRYSLPRAVTAIGSKRLAVVDAFDRVVYITDANGDRVDAIDAGTLPDVSMSSPRCATWVPAAGRLYVTDAGSGRVMVFNVRSTKE